MGVNDMGTDNDFLPNPVLSTIAYLVTWAIRLATDVCEPR